MRTAPLCSTTRTQLAVILFDDMGIDHMAYLYAEPPVAPDGFIASSAPFERHDRGWC